MSKKEDNSNFIPHLKKGKLEAINETYSAYSSEAFEAAKPELSKPVTKQEKEPPTEKKEKSVTDNASKPVVEQAKLDPVKTLSPELKQNIRKIIKETPRDKINKLINITREQKDRLFDKKKGCGVFDSMCSKDADTLKKKMDEWKPAKEVSEINASVTVSWLNKVENDEV